MAFYDVTTTFCRKISQGRGRCSRCYDLRFVVTSWGLMWQLPMIRWRLRREIGSHLKRCYDTGCRRVVRPKLSARRCYDYRSIVGSGKENQRAPTLRSQLGREVGNINFQACDVEIKGPS